MAALSSINGSDKNIAAIISALLKLKGKSSGFLSNLKVMSAIPNRLPGAGQI